MKRESQHLALSVLLTGVLAACGGEDVSKSADVLGTTNSNSIEGTVIGKAAATLRASSVNTPTNTPIVSGALYYLINPNSNKALDVKAAGKADGTVVDIYTQNYTPAQIWQIVSNGDGTYSLNNPNSGNYLDVVAAGTANGTAIDIYTPNGTPAQKWKLNLNSDGTYTLINPNSNKALDITNVGTADGTPLQLYASTGDGGPAQKWNLVPVNRASNLSLLKASGNQLVNASGRVVQLKGVNLGGLYVFEKWMTPMDTGTTNDTFDVMKLLQARFGLNGARSLLNTYQQNWITSADLDNISNAGFNTIRVPVWYGNFLDLDQPNSQKGILPGAFDALDALVANAAARGIYVIIDLHGAIGGQSNDMVTGRGNQNLYWNNPNNQGNTAWLWWQIASHYRGNPAIAGYDLLNEPGGAPVVNNDNGTNAVWGAYDALYNSVRSADPDHMIILEGAYGTWTWDMLPDPKKRGYTNVMYEMHEYQPQSNGLTSWVDWGTNHQVDMFKTNLGWSGTGPSGSGYQSLGWNVPGYIGEFNEESNNNWQYAIQAFNHAGAGAGSNATLNWTMWSYKSTAGVYPGNSWGWYVPKGTITVPNLATDSFAAIQNAWQLANTQSSFRLNDQMGLTP